MCFSCSSTNRQLFADGTWNLPDRHDSSHSCSDPCTQNWYSFLNRILQAIGFNSFTRSMDILAQMFLFAIKYGLAHQ